MIATHFSFQVKQNPAEEKQTNDRNTSDNPCLKIIYFQPIFNFRAASGISVKWIKIVAGAVVENHLSPHVSFLFVKTAKRYGRSLVKLFNFAILTKITDCQCGLRSFDKNSILGKSYILKSGMIVRMNLFMNRKGST